MENKILLKGSSGINIFCYQNSNGKKVIRKQTVARNQIERLKTQYEKHLFLSKRDQSLFHIPEVISYGYDNGNFFYEYRYIEGSSMMQNLLNRSTNELIPILDKLALITEYFSSQDKYYEVSFQDKGLEEALKEKIENVCSKLNLDKEFKKKLITRLSALNMPKYKTLSHGDLSFDNIIIDKQNNIWLIDYIGTFYPHYWLDIAKLFQDMEGGWYQIKHGVKIDNKKTKFLTDYFKKRISEVDKNYLFNHNFLMSTIFLRILPYLKSNLQQKKVFKIIEGYLDA